MTETVNHPAHYGGDTPYEAIKVIEAWELGFGLGNAVKYIARAEHKGNQLEDLRKAAWYLQHEIERLGGQPACTHAWEELNPGQWVCKECLDEVDLTRSPDWTPPDAARCPYAIRNDAEAIGGQCVYSPNHERWDSAHRHVTGYPFGGMAPGVYRVDGAPL